MPDHNHSHSNNGASSSQRSLILALILTTAFAVVEAMAGWLSGSLALLSDAGHMFTDSAALAIGALSAWLSKRPPSARHSYGWKRAEILGALINALLMVGIVIAIAITAIDRLRAPHAIDGTIIMLVAAIGLIINVGAAWILRRGEQNLNVRGAWLHVMGDLLGSVAALVAGIVIWLTGWTPIDALLSLFISALILLSSFRLLNDVTRVLMEGVPKNIDLPEVGRSMASVNGVQEVHDLHIWNLSSELVSLSAHVKIETMQEWQNILRRLRERLKTQYGIEHVTLQPELDERVATVTIQKANKKQAR